MSMKAPDSIRSTNLWGTGGSAAPRKLVVGGSSANMSMSDKSSISLM